MTEGTYGVAIELPVDTTIEVGALGDIAFPAGTYVYVGSAFGPGGFSRLDRHRDVAAGRNDARHWHVDYLLGAQDSRIVAVGTSPGVDRECAIATALSGDAVDGFGASDCGCSSHLFRLPDGRSTTSVLGEHYEIVETEN